MKDTPEHIERLRREMFMALPEEKRQQMWFEMWDVARTLVISSVKQAHPEYSKNEVLAEVFERFHGKEFSSDKREEIKEWIMNYKPR